ncbi:hypothetical protein L1887_61345 [Cichorium endivia]|nr:hypothetical protein L1887_61345 [Cichorium endivia]
MLRTDKQSRWNEVTCIRKRKSIKATSALALSPSLSFTLPPRCFCGVRVFLHPSASPQQFYSCARKCAQIRGYRLGEFSCETRFEGHSPIPARAFSRPHGNPIHAPPSRQITAALVDT